MKAYYFSIILLVVLAVSCKNENSDGVTEKKVEQFSEKNRLQYHFSPPEKWMNDPNGMVYYEGEYHLFYQHYPDSTVWGPMHWGHAVSSDLIHWEHMPVALYPDSLGYIFSGSAVIDKNNTTGFGTSDNPPMVAIFTYHDPKGAEAGEIDFQTQGLAYSLDKGRSWIKFSGNPVLDNPGIVDFRDPKVFWSSEFQKWVMILAVKDHVSIYSSPNLIEWTFESDFGKNIGAHGGVWECPDLFRLKDMQSGKEKWVMLVSINPGGPNGGSATQYFMGDFDGKNYIPEDTETRWLDYGTDNYAGVTWSNVPEQDGRRLFIGWMNNWLYANVVPTQSWRGAMTIPRELILDGGQLKNFPVDELKQLRTGVMKLNLNETNEVALEKSTIDLQLDVINDISGSLDIIFENDMGEEVRIKLKQDSIFVDRSRSGETNFADVFSGVHKAPLQEPLNRVRVLLDVASLEVFVNDGTTVMTEVFFPNEPFNKIRFEGNLNIISKSKGYYLKSIWN